jgi:hypothetical protein
MKKTLLAIVKNPLIAVASAAAALVILILIMGHHTTGGPERTIGQIDGTGRIRFVLSWHQQPAMLDELIMRRKSDGEPVCILNANPKTGGTTSTWRYGEEPEHYEIAGCGTLESGVYRIEFQSRKHGTTYAFGGCEVCMDKQGKISFGAPTCNKGLCVSVH